ncbi:MAG: hypothetical protein M3015_15845 [Bacteroidota bacterium]|nr:hypothetical protein [Bacteroidota bacterium]
MKTENEINNSILKATMEIQEKVPELSKYLTEMPVTIPNISNPEINSKILKEYNDSLDILLKKYSTNHRRKK